MNTITVKKSEGDAYSRSTTASINTGSTKVMKVMQSLVITVERDNNKAAVELCLGNSLKKLNILRKPVSNSSSYETINQVILNILEESPKTQHFYWYFFF